MAHPAGAIDWNKKEKNNHGKVEITLGLSGRLLAHVRRNQSYAKRKLKRKLKDGCGRIPLRRDATDN